MNDSHTRPKCMVRFTKTHVSESLLELPLNREAPVGVQMGSQRGFEMEVSLTEV